MGFFERLIKESIPYRDRIVPVEQEIDGTCGQACLAMIYRAFGERIDERTLVAEMKPDLGMIASKYFGGTTHEQMAESARLHGYVPRMAYNVQYEDLQFITRCLWMPVIVEWMTDLKGTDSSDCHYSVVVDADDRKIKLADPSFGEFRTLPKEEFMRKWMGFEKDGSMTRHFALVIYPRHLCQE